MSAPDNDLEVGTLIHDAYRTMSAHLRKETVDVSKLSELVSRMRWAMMAQANRITTLEEAAASARTMRDDFAGQALPAVIVQCAGDAAFGYPEGIESMEQMFAAKCYALADAMLAERERGLS